MGKTVDYSNVIYFYPYTKNGTKINSENKIYYHLEKGSKWYRAKHSMLPSMDVRGANSTAFDLPEGSA